MTVSSQIIEVLNDLCMKFGMVIDWSQENVMPYVEELITKYISWEIATSWVWIAIGGFLIVLAVVAFILDHCLYLNGILAFLGGTLAFFAICVICTQVFDIVECKVFPEKAVFEYVQLLLSK